MGNQVKLLKSEVQCLKMQILVQNSNVSESLAQARDFKTENIDLKEKLKEEQEKQFAISMNMTRQYKMMREKMLNRIYQLDEQIINHKNHISTQKKEFDEMIQMKDQIIESKEQEIAGWKVT